MMDIHLGPLMKYISAEARWRMQDKFPSSQLWADEVERVLSFLCAHKQLPRFYTRLSDDARARDSALAEARVAFFFFRNGFRITEWDPQGVGAKVGEFSVQWVNCPPVFVEVKAPDWQGELSLAEKLGQRKQQGKAVDCEGRAIAPIDHSLDVVMRNAVPKLSATRPNLIVIVDDLFVSPLDISMLDIEINRFFSRPTTTCVGAIMFFRVESSSIRIDYRFRFIPNQHASAECAIPLAMAHGLRSGQEKRETQKDELPAAGPW